MQCTDDDVHMLRNAGRTDGITLGISDEPNALRTGMNSGFQALGLAIKAGAAKVILLGYDMCYSPDGKTHWHGGHNWPIPEHEYRAGYAESFKRTKFPADVEIINAIPNGLLNCFPRRPLKEVL